MRKSLILAIATVTLGLAASQVRAEGNSEPFPFSADSQVSSGHAFVCDTGSAAYPQLTGESVRESSLSQILPTNSNEAVIQTANSLPGHGTPTSSAFALAQRDR